MVSTIYFGGNIYTMDGAAVQAMAIQDNTILAVGSDEEILKLQEENTTLIDLEGHCVVPGFIDSHAHLLLTGLMFERLDLRGVTSPEEIVSRGKEYIARNSLKPGQWIVGYGFDQNLFENPVLPTGELADQISTVHPILLDRVCGHVAAANPLALREIGITPETVIEGGVIDQDGQGNLTGVLREAALDWFKSQIPKKDLAGIKLLAVETGKKLSAKGITSIHTDDLEAVGIDTLLEACNQLAEEKLLPVRIFEELQAARPDRLKKLIDKGLKTGRGDAYFKTGNIKLLVDGSLGARTAFLRQEYSDDPGNLGISVYTQEELDEIVQMAHNAGWQVACHAIGDGAVELCVNAIEKAQKQNPASLRHRIVHCQIGDRSLYQRMARLNICADVQPPFTASDCSIAPERLGSRIQESYAWKTMMELGVHLGGGSDSPVEDFDPLWGIYCAVTRKDPDGLFPQGWLPEERLTVQQAVELYTKGGAYLSFEEDIKGTLTPGKLADFTVLSKDIFTINPEEILSTKVLLTVMDGSIQYIAEH